MYADICSGCERCRRFDLLIRPMKAFLLMYGSHPKVAADTKTQN